MSLTQLLMMLLLLLPDDDNDDGGGGEPALWNHFSFTHQSIWLFSSQRKKGVCLSGLCGGLTPFLGAIVCQTLRVTRDKDNTSPQQQFILVWFMTKHQMYFVLCNVYNVL